MKFTLKHVAVGTSLILASVAAHSAENFVGLTWGESSNNIQRSSTLKQFPETRMIDHAIENSGTWGIRGGQQTERGRAYATYEYTSDRYSRQYKLRQQNLLASYDAFLPLGPTTNLFGGVSLGLTKLENESPGIRRDSDIGLAGGLQAGILQQVGQNASLEAGYRYLRTNASSDVRVRGGQNQGSFDLNSIDHAYLGVNYRF
ncbi:outer membrane beta-barrel protein [Pseudomonas sp.]|jgi:opacity protein-like surface antigen|uniref:outer membrane beta-barrel protein n=1 Tax=Pseudomonas sp. TaxID=306 RepID=UPI00272B1ADD|nr:outer membrane beta-barrel protein [Pseudomonas sp.]